MSAPKVFNDGTGDGLREFAAPVPCCNVLSIDAWASCGGGWEWNNWHKLAIVPVALCDLKPRALLRELRERGILNSSTAGKLAIEDDGYNIVIMRKGTRMPIIALAYGEVTP